MRTQKLIKIKVLGALDSKYDILSKLKLWGKMHLEMPEKLDTGFVKGVVPEDIESISEYLLKFEFLTSMVKVDKNIELNSLDSLKKVYVDASNFISNYYSKVVNLKTERDELIDKLNDVKSKYNVLASIPFEFKQTKDSLKIFRSNFKRDFDANSVKEIKSGSEYFYLVRGLRNKGNSGLSNIKEIDVSYVKGNSNKTKKELVKQINNLEKNMEVISAKLVELIPADVAKEMSLIYLNLLNHYDICSSYAKTQNSANHFMICGYIDPNDKAQLSKFKDLTILGAKAHKGPSFLKNKGVSRPFQKITELFSLPRYGYVDPSKSIAVFFPLFFGIMLADVGYGLVLLSILLFGFNYLSKDMKPYLMILTLSAISSVIFGLVFGSFFGDLVPLVPLYTDSFSASFTLLILSLVIGLVHLNLGYLFSLYQGYKNKEFFDSVKFVLPFLLLQLSFVLFYFSIVSAGLVLVALAAGILIYANGFFGIMDINGFVGTWFSYARLLALNLATAGVALAVNTMADKALAFGMLGIGLWALILLVGHIFNFVVSMIGITINSARLHYVEFFKQFFAVGGYEFKPLRLITKLQDN